MKTQQRRRRPQIILPGNCASKRHTQPNKAGDFPVGQTGRASPLKVHGTIECEALKQVATCSATPAALLQVRSIRLCPASRALFTRALHREPGLLRNACSWFSRGWSDAKNSFNSILARFPTECLQRKSTISRRSCNRAGPTSRSGNGPRPFVQGALSTVMGKMCLSAHFE